MANELDELRDPINEAGRDARVIEKQLQVKVGTGTKVFEVLMWCTVIGGIGLTISKIKAQRVLDQLQQKIQACASEIDNYLEQRVVILENLAALLNKQMKFEKETLETIAAYRSGISPDKMQEAADKIDNVNTQIKATFERYPELKSSAAFEKAMKDNDYLQREITAARSTYNDAVYQWNSQIMVWPSYKMVASKKGYTTRIPFTTTSEVRQKARSVLFN